MPERELSTQEQRVLARIDERHYESWPETHQIRKDFVRFGSSLGFGAVEVGDDGRFKLRDKAKPCHGYANACDCPDCTELAAQVSSRGFGPDGKLLPEPTPLQPWEQAA